MASAACSAFMFMYILVYKHNLGQLSRGGRWGCLDFVRFYKSVKKRLALQDSKNGGEEGMMLCVFMPQELLYVTLP